MKEIYSKTDPDTLLHIIYRMKDILDQESFRKDVIPADNFLQLAALKLDKLQTFKAHKHIWKDGEEKVIAQESWVVIKGRVQASLYDLDGKEVLYRPILHPGDCTITLGGGHNYVSLDESTLVYEYKTGPYKGIDNDKVFIEDAPEK